jgi:hypothetical protein
MINLDDHIIEIDGEKYVPLNVAQAAVAETYSQNKLDEAMELINKAMTDLSETVNDALEDDDQDSA